MCEGVPWIELARGGGGGSKCELMHAVIHFEFHKSREVHDQLTDFSSFHGILFIETANRDSVNVE
jgi:hypothetical protein